VRLLSRAETLARIGIPRSSWYKLRARGEFPKPLKIGAARLVVWREDDVDAWLRLNPPAPRAIRDP
jgi:prophage regulatory protein